MIMEKHLESNAGFWNDYNIESIHQLISIHDNAHWNTSGTATNRAT